MQCRVAERDHSEEQAVCCQSSSYCEHWQAIGHIREDQCWPPIQTQRSHAIVTVSFDKWLWRTDAFANISIIAKSKSGAEPTAKDDKLATATVWFGLVKTSYGCWSDSESYQLARNLREDKHWNKKTKDVPSREQARLALWKLWIPKPVKWNSVQQKGQFWWKTNDRLLRSSQHAAPMRWVCNDRGPHQSLSRRSISWTIVTQKNQKAGLSKEMVAVHCSGLVIEGLRRKRSWRHV